LVAILEQGKQVIEALGGPAAVVELGEWKAIRAIADLPADDEIPRKLVEHRLSRLETHGLREVI
jgi:hypothetical protein